jgi:virulence-associated protein VagC
MADRTKLFKSGGGQAVQLPKEYRFQDSDEVLIYRQGHRVILEPLKGSWSPAFLALAGSARDFPYPGSPPYAERGPDLE